MYCRLFIMMKIQLNGELLDLGNIAHRFAKSSYNDKKCRFNAVASNTKKN